MDLTPGPFPNPGTEHPGRCAREGEKSSPRPSRPAGPPSVFCEESGVGVGGSGPTGESRSIYLKRGSPAASNRDAPLDFCSRVKPIRNENEYNETNPGYQISCRCRVRPRGRAARGAFHRCGQRSRRLQDRRFAGRPYAPEPGTGDPIEMHPRRGERLTFCRGNTTI